MEYLQPIPTTLSSADLLQAFYGCLENSDDGFLIVSPDGCIAYINQAYCSYLKKDRASILGKPVLDYIDTSTLVSAASDTDYPSEQAVLHRVSEMQYADGEHFCIVNRCNVSVDGHSIAGTGQIKFIRSTLELSASIKEMFNEIAYYKEELERLKADHYSINQILGSSSKMSKAKEMILKASTNDFPVLITGETGTGKELFANAVHYSSDRKNRPYIRINCASIPENLFESELFGYERGSFTGANKTGKKGKFELAHTGTLFLDEIGDMPLNMQAKLLRVLQEKEVERIGSEKPMPIDVRIIAATNKNLLDEIHEKRFRADLYYRLNVITIVVPPLREHPTDINLLIDSFIEELNIKYHQNVTVSSTARNILCHYSWPGNIRELKNIIERCFALQENGLIQAATIPASILTSAGPNTDAANDTPEESLSLEASVNAFEKNLLLTAIRAHKGNLQATAKALKIHRMTLYKKLEKYGLKREDF